MFSVFFGICGMVSGLPSSNDVLFVIVIGVYKFYYGFLIIFVWNRYPISIRRCEGYCVCGRLMNMMKSFMFRYNAGCKIWPVLGKLAKKGD